MPEFDTVFFVLVTGSFVAALCNAAFSAGGAMIILALTSIVLPISAMVPIHSTLLFGSTSMRAYLFRDFIAWRIAGPFLIGSVFGSLLGAYTYFAIPEEIIAAAIGIIMLVAIWLPKLGWQPSIPHPWGAVGVLHSFLSATLAYGAVLHAVILHTSLERRQIVGTLGGCLFGMGVFKILGYILNGFDYSPYLHIIAASIFVSFFGTWLGRRLVDRLSERVFRSAFRVLITLTAVRLVWMGIQQFLATHTFDVV